MNPQHTHSDIDKHIGVSLTLTLNHEPFVVVYERVLYYNIGRVFVSLFLENDVVVHVSIRSIAAFRSEPLWE